MSESSPRFDLEMDEQGGGIPAQLRDPVGVLRRGWRWSLAAFVLLIIPTVVVSRLIPLEFEAASRLMLTSKAIPDAFVRDTIVASGSEQFQTIENRVLTRENLREIVRISGAFAKERETQTLAAVIDDFGKAIQIEKSKVSSSRRRESSSSIEIRVSLRGSEPKQVADLVNYITADLINEFLDYRGEQSKVTSDFMRREFERADQDLRQHQRTLAIFRERNRGSLPEEQPATIGKLERLESQRRSIILQINDARVQLNMAGATSSLGGTTVSPRVRMQIELNRLLGLYTDEHPQVQSLRHQIALFDEASHEDPETRPSPRFIPDSRARLENEITARRSRLDEIDAEVTRLEIKVAQTSGITEEYRALEREEVLLQEAYTNYLRKLKSAELSQSMDLAQQGTQLIRLESARPPTQPIIPRVVFTAAALITTLAGSLLFAVLRELLNPVVIDSAHLEQITSLPSLGSIPPIATSA